MGKHRGKSDLPVLAPPTPQEKADSFDRQHAASVQRAEAKRRAGAYPYDFDQRPSEK